jgi:putative addiction module component (TIGR02574 family)
MTMSTDDLLAEALRLSREERARVAAELLSSLEEMDEEVVAIWAEELLRRSADVRAGRVSPVSWTTARQEILTELADRRARRASS